MQINCQTNDEFRYRCNNYKDNNPKSLKREEHKQAGFFVCFQTPDHSSFINDTEIKLVEKTDPSDPTKHENFWIDCLKTRCLGLNNIDPYQ